MGEGLEKGEYWPTTLLAKLVFACAGGITVNVVPASAEDTAVLLTDPITLSSLQWSGVIGFSERQPTSKPEGVAQTFPASPTFQ